MTDNALYARLGEAVMTHFHVRMGCPGVPLPMVHEVAKHGTRALATLFQPHKVIIPVIRSKNKSPPSVASGEIGRNPPITD